MGYPDEANRRPEMPRETELDAMSPSRLADAMERALDDMTEETYDPAALRACLEALERAAPVPPHAGAQDAARRVEDWIQQQGAPEEPERKPGGQSPARRRGLLRGGLAAALVTACLFGAVAAAQAAGWNVFGAVARWTAETFSFGKLPEEREEPPAPSVPTSELPPEYDEMRAILEEDGQILYFPQIPSEFELSYSDLYIDPLTGEADLAVEYRNGETYIAFGVIQHQRPPTGVYEKTDDPVERYELYGITHYIFSNSANITAVWLSGPLEYSIWTNDMSYDLKALIRSMYADGETAPPPTVELPPEYEEMRAILEEDGQTMYFPQIPEGYELSYSDLYLDPLTGEADFAVEYSAGDTYIAYRAVQFGEVPVTVYEKDGTPMVEYEENGITHYIFQNNGNKTAAWISGWLECSIGTNDMSMDLRALIRSMY